MTCVFGSFAGCGNTATTETTAQAEPTQPGEEDTNATISSGIMKR